jgi:hypothetical protein
MDGTGEPFLGGCNKLLIILGGMDSCAHDIDACSE